MGIKVANAAIHAMMARVRAAELETNTTKNACNNGHDRGDENC